MEGHSFCLLQSNIIYSHKKGSITDLDIHAKTVFERCISAYKNRPVSNEDWIIYNENTLIVEKCILIAKLILEGKVLNELNNYFDEIKKML